MEQTLEPIAALATKPISPEAPAGTWVRYQPEFEALKQQIDKITTTRPQDVDWGQVVSTASGILESQSKDLLVASYLAAGLQVKQGVPGLVDGLTSVTEMCQAFWDSLYPETKRMRARISALEWLVERVSGETKKMAPRPADGEGIAKALAVVERLEGLLEEKLGGEAPSLGDLTRALEDLKERASAPPKEEAPAKPAVRVVSTVPRAAAAPTAAAAAPDLSTPEAVDKALDQSLSGLREIAGAIRKVKPQDPAAYRLARLAAWLQLADLPANTEGTTRIPPLGAGPQLAARYQEMVAGQGFSELLEQAEYQFEKSVFWLDAQRFVCQALQGLGKEYDAALEGVKQECRGLLKRLPGLLDLKFSNGTPFADDETRAWVQQQVLARTDGGDGASQVTVAAPAAPSGDDELESVLKEVGSVSQQGLPDAVRRLGGLVDAARNGRQRFQRRLALAKFMVKAKEPRLAVAHLERLQEEIDRFGLEDWEPSLAVQVLGLLVSCYKQLLNGPWKNMPGAAEKAEQIFLKLALLDGAAAAGHTSR
ncbi:MAG TPA: type VI secretion system protein TssA [Candidatus Polarisedimenticolia bacterium]|nr:type VI secretion system protein TssA [Candidatus Polarisedimenticolia bacterium]